MPKKTKPIAVLPEDLRERDDLTIGQANRIATLRSRREDLVAELADLDKQREQVAADIAAGDKEVREILGQPEPEPEPVAASDID